MSGRVPSLWLLACIALVASGCDVPMPLAPAEPVGEPPTWGDSFALPAEQPPSLLGAGLGNSGLPAGTVSPGDTGDWSGGDAVSGHGGCLSKEADYLDARFPERRSVGME